jgi:hypothetical protein
VTFSSIYQQLQTTASHKYQGAWHKARSSSRGNIMNGATQQSTTAFQSKIHDVNSSYGNWWTGCEDPRAWLPFSPYLTPLDFYWCGYKGVGVTGSQA